jgi:hypothetical protein
MCCSQGRADCAVAGKVVLLHSIPISDKLSLFLSGIGIARQDVAPKCEAFREARRDRVPAAADNAKLHGCSFALELELNII